MANGSAGREIVVNTMGNCSIRVDDQAQNGIPLSFYKIAVYILLSGPGQIVSRESVRSMLWSEVRDRERAAADLRQSLMRIRRVQNRLGFRLIESNLTSIYLVDDTATRWDLRDFLRQIGSPGYDGRIDYPGELLADLPYSGTDFEDWLVEQRHHLRNQVIEFLSHAIMDDTDIGGDRRYVHARDLLRIDPCNEEAYRLLMIKAATNRDFAQLEYLFKRCEDSLQRDLGVRVSPETRSLHTGLVRALSSEGQWGAHTHGPPH